MTNIQEIYLEENLSTLNSGGGYHHKVNNKSVNYNTTRNFFHLYFFHLYFYLVENLQNLTLFYYNNLQYHLIEFHLFHY